MGKRDFQELMEFARSNDLMNVPLNIVIQKFRIYKGSAGAPFFVYTKTLLVLTDCRVILKIILP